MMYSKPDKVHKARTRIAAKLYAELMERAGGCCMQCGRVPDFRGLQMHHLKLKGMGGTKKPDTAAGLAVLCAGCHAKAHRVREA